MQRFTQKSTPDINFLLTRWCITKDSTEHQPATDKQRASPHLISTITTKNYTFINKNLFKKTPEHAKPQLIVISKRGAIFSVTSSSRLYLLHTYHSYNTRVSSEGDDNREGDGRADETQGGCSRVTGLEKVIDNFVLVLMFSLMTPFSVRAWHCSYARSLA